jgi:hypothetical protein
MKETKQISYLIKILLAIIGTIITIALAALGLVPDKQCVKDSYTSQPKNIWICDKYVQ